MRPGLFSKLGVYLFLAVAVLLTVAPLAYLVTGAFKTREVFFEGSRVWVDAVSHEGSRPCSARSPRTLRSKSASRARWTWGPSMMPRARAMASKVDTRPGWVWRRRS